MLNFHFKYSGQHGVDKVNERVVAPPAHSALRLDGFRPSFYDAAELLVLLMPTSCIVERIFSMLDARFGKRQSRTMANRILIELMLAFHQRPL